MGTCFGTLNNNPNMATVPKQTNRYTSKLINKRTIFGLGLGSGIDHATKRGTVWGLGCRAAPEAVDFRKATTLVKLGRAFGTP